MSQARPTRHFARSARRGEEKKIKLFFLFSPRLALPACFALRAKCRVCLVWLIKLLVCRPSLLYVFVSFLLHLEFHWDQSVWHQLRIKIISVSGTQVHTSVQKVQAPLLAVAFYIMKCCNQVTWSSQFYGPHQTIVSTRWDWLPGKHQTWNKRCCSLCWKLPAHAQTFVFCSLIVTE